MPPSPLPPGQQLAAAGKWPVVGERLPKSSSAPWTVSIGGAVERALCWTLPELRALPQVTCAIDIHCVTRWSKLGVRCSGVRLVTLLELAGIANAARYVSFLARSERRHSTSLVLAEALALDPLVAFAVDDEPLTSEHGGPVRMIVPGRYFYKSVKWLERIELLDEDRLGYWEAESGYHNQADPWREQRYIAPGLSKQQAAALLVQRNFADRDLRGIDAAGCDLSRLIASRALLRDANFRHAMLRDACFDDANLSNAHLEFADLQGASFLRADCEGANFTSAQLAASDFTGASLFGASFVDEQSGVGATFDARTRIAPAAIEALTPLQAAYVRQHLPALPG
ncbi:MAG TPA: molybdopterin-dependent oxidoreductase [Pirellulaceae bacterium]|nr:molybdopterin-dependent oxidoreductase [Pirellulaceae bacterium]